MNVNTFREGQVPNFRLEKHSELTVYSEKKARKST